MSSKISSWREKMNIRHWKLISRSLRHNAKNYRWFSSKKRANSILWRMSSETKILSLRDLKKLWEKKRPSLSEVRELESLTTNTKLLRAIWSMKCWPNTSTQWRSACQSGDSETDSIFLELEKFSRKLWTRSWSWELAEATWASRNSLTHILFQSSKRSMTYKQQEIGTLKHLFKDRWTMDHLRVSFNF